MGNTTEPAQRHDGRNVKRVREMLKVKQTSLAYALGEEWNQKKISQLEDKEAIDDKLMEEIAGALKVPVGVIKNFDENATMMNIQHTYEAASNNSNTENYNYQCDINPIEKWTEALEEIKRLNEESKKLYERLLQTEREKVELLQKMLNERK